MLVCVLLENILFFVGIFLLFVMILVCVWVGCDCGCCLFVGFWFIGVFLIVFLIFDRKFMVKIEVE